MTHPGRTLLLAITVVVLIAAVAHGQVPQGGRGGAPGAPAAGGRGGGPAFPALMQAPPKPLVANAKPVRSCESLASVALPDTTIESAAVDPSNPGICRVTAITTHPPAGDRIRIWVAIPTANWNGAGGPGPQPTGLLEAIIAWVEGGTAPETILATRREPSGVTRSRPLCSNPLVARYRGAGSTDDAANFTCSAGF